MNTETLEQFEVMNVDMLALVEGGKRPGGAPITGMTKEHWACLAAGWGAFYGGVLNPITLIGTVPGALVACSNLP
ncbi:bacteriocin [Streptococcus suis]|uniref:Bacteriocin class II with double-glycine leader peptide n=1 Tax=Streptococcus suis TaxID=1307 RepID=A0A0Z8E9C3_STRSU|nr:bacteriocin [Streptococcus suis]MCK4043090.1 bacteriocin [Streptococcus suis]NQH51679.1 bacteriocin [Streptococcus suis]NQO80068.1 bacteriocin [Streptococcus suis]NQO88481.1 bacteriocin [Streptococcus suis]NQP67136.1 bacteriocin [Streptococcus suis]